MNQERADFEPLQSGRRSGLRIILPDVHSRTRGSGLRGPVAACCPAPFPESTPSKLPPLSPECLLVALLLHDALLWSLPRLGCILQVPAPVLTCAGQDGHDMAPQALAGGKSRAIFSRPQCTLQVLRGKHPEELICHSSSSLVPSHGLSRAWEVFFFLMLMFSYFSQRPSQWVQVFLGVCFLGGKGVWLSLGLGPAGLWCLLAFRVFPCIYLHFVVVARGISIPGQAQLLSGLTQASFLL